MIFLNKRKKKIIPTKSLPIKSTSLDPIQTSNKFDILSDKMETDTDTDAETSKTSKGKEQKEYLHQPGKYNDFPSLLRFRLHKTGNYG